MFCYNTCKVKLVAMCIAVVGIYNTNYFWLTITTPYYMILFQLNNEKYK